MTDLLAELDDQMRTERMQEIWHRHGKFIIAALVGIVMLTALYSGYQTWDQKKRIQDTEAMFAVLKNEDFPNNVTVDANLNLRPSMKAVVMMNAAWTYLKKDNGQTSALALYEDLANDKTIPNEFRDLALLNQIRLKLSMDTIKPAQALDAIKALTANEKGAYYAPALIETATLQAAQNDYTAALASIATVNAMTNLPETIYLKARTLQHVYTLKQSKAEKK